MVPSAFHWRNSLALTDNGKIDRKALTALAGELDVAEQDHHGPSTATEHRLAAAWADALRIPQDQIGRRAHSLPPAGPAPSGAEEGLRPGTAASVNDRRRCPISSSVGTAHD